MEFVITFNKVHGRLVDYFTQDFAVDLFVKANAKGDVFGIILVLYPVIKNAVTINAMFFHNFEQIFFFFS